MRKAILSAVTTVLIALALAAAQAKPKTMGQDSPPGPYQVKIDNFSFGPASLTIPAGASVTWTNQDDVPHTVVSKDGKNFKSPVLDTDQKFTHAFVQAGTYEYYCSVHPHMTGKVIVR